MSHCCEYCELALRLLLLRKTQLTSVIYMRLHYPSLSSVSSFNPYQCRKADHPTGHKIQAQNNVGKWLGFIVKKAAIPAVTMATTGIAVDSSYIAPAFMSAVAAQRGLHDVQEYLFGKSQAQQLLF